MAHLHPSTSGLPLRYLQADLPSSTTTQPAPIQAAIIHSAAPSFGSGNTPPHQQPWLSFPAGAAARAAAQPPDRIPPLQAGSQQPAATHATASSSPCWPRTSDGSQIHGSPSPCATCSRARSRPAPRPLRRDLHPSTSGRVTPLMLHLSWRFPTARRSSARSRTAKNSPNLQQIQIQREFRRAASSSDPRQPVVRDQHGSLPQHLGYRPMQSDSEELHHSDRNGDSPGDDQIPQCECLFLLLSFIK